GAWYVGPLDSADEAWLDSLARAFPALAHAVPLPSDPSRVRSPRHLIAASWDAVADVLVRTAAALQVCAEPSLASRVPVSAEHLRPWLESAAQVRPLAVTVGLRVVLPEEPGTSPA